MTEFNEQLHPRSHGKFVEKVMTDPGIDILAAEPGHTALEGGAVATDAGMFEQYNAGQPRRRPTRDSPERTTYLAGLGLPADADEIQIRRVELQQVKAQLSEYDGAPAAAWPDPDAAKYHQLVLDRSELQYELDLHTSFEMAIEGDMERMGPRHEPDVIAAREWMAGPSIDPVPASKPGLFARMFGRR